MNNEERIITTWRENAAPWTTAVREEQIVSRALVTNRAILNAILDRDVESVLDLGCGEGWLCRALAGNGVQTFGIDATPALIEDARRQGGAEYQIMSYDEFAGGLLEGTFDVVACNFSLLGKESVERALRAVPDVLKPGGACVIQTLHPVISCGDHPYQDGWREGSWDGFDETFSNPAPWYFRTLASWVALLDNCGLRVVNLLEPVHPTTGIPVSVIFVAENS